MPHDLDHSTGHAAIFTAHPQLVPPWHGLGTVVRDAPTSDDAIRLARLDWTVEQWPLHAAPPGGAGGESAPAPGHVAKVRTDTRAVLGVVTPRYEPFQNADAFRFADALVGEGNRPCPDSGSFCPCSSCWASSPAATRSSPGPMLPQRPWHPMPPARLLWPMSLALMFIVLLLIAVILPDFLSPGPAPSEGGGGSGGGNDASPVILAQLRELGELTVVALPMSQTLQLRLDGYIGGTECWVHARGEVRLGTDLTHATLGVDEAARRVTVTLAPPRPLAVTLDPGGVRLIATHRRGLWPPIPADVGEARLVAEAVDLARRRMPAAVADSHLAQACGQAEPVLQALVARQTPGWTCLVVWAGL